jgi:rubredoxin
VCADCGYIYNRDECAGLFFEEQSPGFRCPQCSGPRRRYAKMVGDKVGTTLDGGDAPILIFSFGGLALTIAFGVWATNNL